MTPLSARRKSIRPVEKCTEKFPQTRCSIEMKEAVEKYRRSLGLDFGQAIRRLLLIGLHVESLDLSQHTESLNPDGDHTWDKMGHDEK